MMKRCKRVAFALVLAIPAGIAVLYPATIMLAILELYLGGHLIKPSWYETAEDLVLWGSALMTWLLVAVLIFHHRR